MASRKEAMSLSGKPDLMVGMEQELLMASGLVAKANDLESLLRAVWMSLHDHPPVEIKLQRIYVERQIVIENVYDGSALSIQTVPFKSLPTSNRQAFISNQIMFEPREIPTGEIGSVLLIPIIEGKLMGQVLVSNRIVLKELNIPFAYMWKNVVAIWVKGHPEVLNPPDEKMNFMRIDELTARQRIIFEMMLDGSTNNEIAQAIGYSESLVKAETVIIFKTFDITGRKDPKFINYVSELSK
jgi:DNA-binding CsgD family transcriptional regulator